MKRIEVDCFEVTEPDGGGMYDIHVAYATTETVAKALTEKNPGWPRTVRKFKKTFVIVDTVDEYSALVDEQARERAMLKLTDADKKALGL